MRKCIASGKLIYQPTRVVCYNCVFIWRQFVFAFAVEVFDDPNKPELERKFDAALTSKASENIISAFASSAAKALASYSDTTSVGWIDQPDVVCRAHRKKPSLVLASPYFEDVEYCLRLITENGLTFNNGIPHMHSYDGMPRAPSIFRIQSEIVVAVTKNPASPYRQPTTDEETPFGEVLVKLTDSTKTLVANDIKGQGWKLENEAGPGTTSITGLDKRAPDAKP